LNKLTLQEAKDVFAATSFCDHEYLTKPYSPYMCPTTKIVTCEVCAKEIDRFYVDIIANSGIKNS